MVGSFADAVATDLHPSGRSQFQHGPACSGRFRQPLLFPDPRVIAALTGEDESEPGVGGFRVATDQLQLQSGFGFQLQFERAGGG